MQSQGIEGSKRQKEGQVRGKWGLWVTFHGTPIWRYWVQLAVWPPERSEPLWSRFPGLPATAWSSASHSHGQETQPQQLSLGWGTWVCFSHLAPLTRVVGNIDLTFLHAFLSLQSTLWDLLILNLWQPLAMWKLWVCQGDGGGRYRVWDWWPSEWAPSNQAERFIWGEKSILWVGKHPKI